MGRGVVLFQKLVGVRPWQVGGDDRPRIFLEIREGIYSHRQISALLRISFFFLANSLNLFGWEVCKGPVSGPHSYQLCANRQCQLQSTIFDRGWPCKKNTSKRSYSQKHDPLVLWDVLPNSFHCSVKVQTTSYAPRSRHLSLGWPGCVPAYCPPYGTDQMKCVLSGLQVFTVLY